MYYFDRDRGNHPLTYIYVDMEGISQPLTPLDLIYGQQIMITPNGRHFEVTSTSKSLTKQAKHQFKVLQQFTDSGEEITY